MNADSEGKWQRGDKPLRYLVSASLAVQDVATVWNPKWRAASRRCTSPERSTQCCGAPDDQSNAAASCRASAAFSGNRSSSVSACDRSGSLGCTSRQTCRSSSSRLLAAVCSATVSSPVRRRRSKALHISMGVAHQTTIPYFLSKRRTEAVGRCWTQRGTRTLVSQKAEFNGLLGHRWRLGPRLPGRRSPLDCGRRGPSPSLSPAS